MLKILEVDIPKKSIGKEKKEMTMKTDNEIYGRNSNSNKHKNNKIITSTVAVTVAMNSVPKT